MRGDSGSSLGGSVIEVGTLNAVRLPFVSMGLSGLDVAMGIRRVARQNEDSDYRSDAVARINSIISAMKAPGPNISATLSRRAPRGPTPGYAVEDDQGVLEGVVLRQPSITFGFSVSWDPERLEIPRT